MTLTDIFHLATLIFAVYAALVVIALGVLWIWWKVREVTR